MVKLIGFTGLKGSGKDTAAAVLVMDGWVRVQMAGALKGMLRSLLQYQGLSDWRTEAMVEGDLKETPCPELGGKSPRFAMQTLGTEWGRDALAQDLWVDAACAKILQFDSVVVTDVRFQNEVDMIHGLGGRVVRIVRGGRIVDLHSSEAGINELNVDAVLYNSGSIEFLQTMIRAYTHRYVG